MKGLVIRILKQMGNDRRTLALMIAAPILILSLLYLLLGEGSYIPRIAVPENFPAALMTELQKQDVVVTILPDGGKTWIFIFCFMNIGQNLLLYTYFNFANRQGQNVVHRNASFFRFQEQP